MNTNKQQADLTHLLHAWHAGDSKAGNAVFEHTYNALKAIASNRLRNADTMMQATELAHESFLVLCQKEDINWHDRKHFFAIAANAIRHLLVDRARARYRQKRGGNSTYIPLDDIQIPIPNQPFDWIELDNILKELEQIDKKLTQIMELRLIMGLTVREAAEVMEVSTATISRKWNFGLAWMHHRLPNTCVETGIAALP